MFLRRRSLDDKEGLDLAPVLEEVLASDSDGGGGREAVGSISRDGREDRSIVSEAPSLVDSGRAEDEETVWGPSMDERSFTIGSNAEPSTFVGGFDIESGTDGGLSAGEGVPSDCPGADEEGGFGDR